LEPCTRVPVVMRSKANNMKFKADIRRHVNKLRGSAGI
jgi:hypothetical protein